MTAKPCSKCKKTLPAANFCTDKHAPKGLKSRCRACVAEDKALWREKNPEKAREWHAAWVKNNPDKVKAATARHREPRREALEAKSAAWRLENPGYVTPNPEKRRATAKRWMQANKAKCIEYGRVARERGGPEGRAAAVKSTQEWYASNPDRVLEQRAISKARRTPAAWADTAATGKIYIEARRQRYKTGRSHHVDHVYPIFGLTVSGLHVEANLQIICASSNLKKHNKLPGHLSIELWDPTGHDVYHEALQ